MLIAYDIYIDNIKKKQLEQFQSIWQKIIIINRKKKQQNKNTLANNPLHTAVMF